MSRQEMRVYGKREFNVYPLITMEPLPTCLPDYYKNAVKGETGSRMKNKNKHLICGKTARTYLFWDNLMHHYKYLAPLYGRKIEFKEYTCPHDNWLFNYSENLKLHNKVFQFEQAEATLVEQRVNLNNPDWKHPSQRNEQRYLEDEAEPLPRPGVKRSRFLVKEPPVVQLAADRRRQEAAQAQEAELVPVVSRPSTQPVMTHKPANKYDFPYDPDMLEPLPAPKPKKNPEYFGWSHSDDADSWFLEAKTPSVHQLYEDFYDESIKKKVICPKLYSTAC